MAGVEKDEQFYMTLVTIQVEDRLFRVPRRALESQSKVFRDMFSLPQAENTDGLSDDNPIRLEGIGKDEFKRFIDVLFRSSWEETAEDGPVFDMWFPVAKMARMWECDKIFKYAIKNMPYQQVCKSPAEKVWLAFKYDIKSWLLLGVNELARRREPLGVSDFEHLGVELTLKVAAVRESLTIDCGYALTPGTRNASRLDFTPVIKHAFHISDGDADSEISEANAKPIKRRQNFTF